MPGRSYIRDKLVSQALGCRKLIEKDLDECVRRLLQLVKKVEPLGIPANAPETTIDTEETAATLRDIAVSSIVLLKNEQSVLPFHKDTAVRSSYLIVLIMPSSTARSRSLVPMQRLPLIVAVDQPRSGPTTL